MSSSSGMPGSWVTSYPAVKQHLTPRMRKNCRMSKEHVHPRFRLAQNLQVLMEAHGITSPQLAKEAGVAPKTMNNFLKGRYNPRLGNIEKVANFFGLTTWQLLVHDMTIMPAATKDVLQLIERFCSVSEEGRKAIMQVAELASRNVPQ